jgi:hypothetical protein
MFLSYLILRHTSRSSDQKTKPKPEIRFKKKNISLLVHLGSMLLFLWVSVGIWLVAYTFPTQSSPWQTSIRILGNHLSLWYPILIYYFFELLKKVQLKSRGSEDPKNSKKPMLLVDMKNCTKDIELEPTQLLKSTNTFNAQR